MTRTQTHTYGVAISSSRQLLLVAMLCAFAWLVSNVASMLATIFNRYTRDWHAGRTDEAQLLTSNDMTKGTETSSPSFSGKREARILGIPVVSSRGTTTHSPQAANPDARHKAEHDTVGVASRARALLPRPGEALHALTSPRWHSGGGPPPPIAQSGQGGAPPPT